MTRPCKSIPTKNHIRMVYFAAAPEGPIKIGMTCDVKRRLRELRTKTKLDLAILATIDGGSPREGLYHSRFLAHHIEGEWFERHPDILAEINRLNPTNERIGGDHV